MGAVQQNDRRAKKKLRETVREYTGALFMLRCAELGLHTDDLAGMDMGMVYDLATEKENDEIQYPYKATQEDIEAFFGKG